MADFTPEILDQQNRDSLLEKAREGNYELPCREQIEKWFVHVLVLGRTPEQESVLDGMTVGTRCRAERDYPVDFIAIIKETSSCEGIIMGKRMDQIQVAYTIYLLPPDWTPPACPPYSFSFSSS
jgi:hypothetical protein